MFSVVYFSKSKVDGSSLYKWEDVSTPEEVNEAINFYFLGLNAKRVELQYNGNTLFTSNSIQDKVTDPLEAFLKPTVKPYSTIEI